MTRVKYMSTYKAALVDLFFMFFERQDRHVLSTTMTTPIILRKLGVVDSIEQIH